LFQRAQQGDESALAELLERYGDLLRGAAQGLLGPALRAHLDAADLVQSVHCILLVSLREHKLELGSPERLLGLALTLIRRRVARRWRRLKQQAGVTDAAATTAETVPAWDDASDPTRKLQITDEVQRPRGGPGGLHVAAAGHRG
jgi:DNA-directed RNA polymerase specialized sigma24 family protein